MSANDPHSILNRDPNRGRIEQKTKVTQQRYRAGIIPEWAQKEVDPNETEFRRSNLAQGKGALQYKGMTADSSAIIIDTSQGKQAASSMNSGYEEILVFDGGNTQADIVQHDPNRRTMLKMRLLEQEQKMASKNDQVDEDQNNGDDEDDEGLFGDEEDLPIVVDDPLLGNLTNKLQEDADLEQLDENGYDEDEEEQQIDEDDQEQEQQQQQQLLKPVYVSRTDRETLGERDKLQEQIEQEREFERKKKEEKKQYTKQLVAESIQREQQMKDHEAVDQYDSDANLPFEETDYEDRDYLNSQVAYEEWKLRELRRIKRDRDEREAREREMKEIERRRNMTDAEREEENRRLGSDATNKKEGVAYTFMQKYYHKGAFFQDRSDAQDLFQRDYNMPVGFDKMDKSVLPAVLQKRRGDAGKRGNSKWTHLTNEDTTNFDPAHRVQDNIAFRTQLKQGGYKGMNQLDRPSVRKRHF